MSAISIRRASKADIPALMQVFTQSVHQIASNSYSRAQLDAWAPQELDEAAWINWFDGLISYLAEIDSEIAGFISLLAPAHIEMLFTAPAQSRRGVASALYQHMLESECANRRPLTTDASFEARPFFERQGWRVVNFETVRRRSQSLGRYQMVLA